jgi:hypothetical protein
MEGRQGASPSMEILSYFDLTLIRGVGTAHPTPDNSDNSGNTVKVESGSRPRVTTQLIP